MTNESRLKLINDAIDATVLVTKAAKMLEMSNDDIKKLLEVGQSLIQLKGQSDQSAAVLAAVLRAVL